MDFLASDFLENLSYVPFLWFAHALNVIYRLLSFALFTTLITLYQLLQYWSKSVSYLLIHPIFKPAQFLLCKAVSHEIIKSLNQVKVLGRQEWLSREGAEYTATPTEKMSSAVIENVLQSNYTERERD